MPLPFPTIDADAVIGCLLGQAVGDALGLPMENLSPRRISRLFPDLDGYHFLFGRGLGSDDTEHACMTAQAMLRSGGDPVRFRRSLAWRLRWWFAGVPAGIGKATARACIRLWLGWPSDRSGVRSAGNGPAMRATILFVADEPFAIASTHPTHRDPQAELGARATRIAAMAASQNRDAAFDPTDVLRELDSLTAGSNLDIARHLAALGPALLANRTVAEFAESLGLSRGVTGYIAHTVPVAIYAFLRHPDDFRTAVQSVIRCGGDTDTVAAIAGAFVGTRVGKAGIPSEWLAKLAEWPRSVGWMEKLGGRLAEGTWRESPQPAVALAWWALPFRNFLFFVLVLIHAARRLLPPY